MGNGSVKVYKTGGGKKAIKYPKTKIIAENV